MGKVNRYTCKRVWLCAVIALALTAGCQAAAPAEAIASPTTGVKSITATPSSLPTAQPANTPAPFELTSPAFENEGFIPRQFACTGDDISPELNWGRPPAGTQSFALIFDDPTFSPGWVHWVIYNIPPAARGLPEGISAGDEFAPGALQGANSWGERAYGGPCPPEGSTHTYIFSLYALDIVLDLEPGASKRELLAAMEGRVLAQIDLSATFTR